MFWRDEIRSPNHCGKATTVTTNVLFFILLPAQTEIRYPQCRLRTPFVSWTYSVTLTTSIMSISLAIQELEISSLRNLHTFSPIYRGQMWSLVSYPEDRNIQRTVLVWTELDWPISWGLGPPVQLLTVKVKQGKSLYLLLQR